VAELSSRSQFVSDEGKKPLTECPILADIV